ncbi:MAG: hypothetical protein H6581_17030 [Bacteroidia bacterium]|nr:hypothetical protein [Bacteroidia bacterium]
MFDVDVRRWRLVEYWVIASFLWQGLLFFLLPGLGTAVQKPVPFYKGQNLRFFGECARALSGMVPRQPPTKKLPASFRGGELL